MSEVKVGQEITKRNKAEAERERKPPNADSWVTRYLLDQRGARKVGLNGREHIFRVLIDENDRLLVSQPVVNQYGCFWKRVPEPPEADENGRHCGIWKVVEDDGCEYLIMKLADIADKRSQIWQLVSDPRGFYRWMAVSDPPQEWLGEKDDAQRIKPIPTWSRWWEEKGEQGWSFDADVNDPKSSGGQELRVKYRASGTSRNKREMDRWIAKVSARAPGLTQQQILRMHGRQTEKSLERRRPRGKGGTLGSRKKQVPGGKRRRRKSR